MADFRKIIRFGKNSLIISLPKSWTEHNGLKAGDSVLIETLSRDLIISPRYSGDDSATEKDIVINADKDEFQTLKRRIIAAYIDNYDSITVKGGRVVEYAARIRDTMHGLMALEIMEESPEKIVAKCFLNTDDISLFSIVRKVDNIIKSMFVDYISQVKEPSKYGDMDIAQNISVRDRDVNRLTTLVFRTIKFYLENPRAKREIHDSAVLLNLWDASRILEKIGDEIKRSSRLTKPLSEEQALGIIDLIDMIYVHYQGLMQAMFKRDIEAAYKLELLKKHQWSLVEAFREKSETSIEMSKAIQKVISLYHRVHDLSLMVR